MKELKNLNILYTKGSVDEDFLSFLNGYVKEVKEVENIEQIDKLNCDIVLTTYDSELMNLKDKRVNFLLLIPSNKQILLEESQLSKFITLNTSKDEIISFFKKSVKNLDSNQSNLIDLKNDFIFDSYNSLLYKKGKNISCSKKELMFLDYIIQNQSRVVNYDEINKLIWEGTMTNDALRSIVKELRKKTYKELIKNISGMGYRINI